MGAANPVAALEKTAEIVWELGLKGLRLAAISGDDVLEQLEEGDPTLLESGLPLSSIRDQVISANAYLGAGPIRQALENGAQVILTGRVADPALYVAPVCYEFGWDMEDFEKMGKATLLGHLMECAGQVTGGYFADPGLKEISGLERLGFPIAEIGVDGEFIITKLDNAGGQVTEATCKEQLLYEIHDPAKYLTPDVVADFSKVKVTEIAKDRVHLTGAGGKPKTGTLKVSVGYRDSYIGEGQISYAGHGAKDRAELASRIIKERIRDLQSLEERFDLIGINSIIGNGAPGINPAEVRLRVAIRTASMQEALKIGQEVEALYTNGPAGGGGVTKSAREVIAIQSILIGEDKIETQIKYLDT